MDDFSEAAAADHCSDGVWGKFVDTKSHIESKAKTIMSIDRCSCGGRSDGGVAAVMSVSCPFDLFLDSVSVERSPDADD